jgi:coenzyme F420-reducing hydrogenase beta subunit
MIAIENKNMCTGCSSCCNICPHGCITMNIDIEGFWYPVIDDQKCSQCGLCNQVCPVLYKQIVDNDPRAYACINNNESVRRFSSSGGVFTLIAEAVINQGGIVFGAKFDENFFVSHCCAETLEGIEEFRGAKYIQSKIGDSYKLARFFLDQERKVLFSGTPCQIGGLKTYLGKNYEHLFCVDFICHGVPSPKVWQYYLRCRIDNANSPISKVAFRNKDKGWKSYSVLLNFQNGTEYRRTRYQDLYIRAYLKDICLRPSCYNCAFKTLHRQSEITLADFWGIQNILPEMDDDKGTSLVIVNSIRGENMLNKIANKIIFKQVNLEKSIYFNSSAIQSMPIHPKRKKFFEELNKKPFDKLVKKYCSDPMIVRLKRNVNSLLKVLKK